jgi:diguanylate cyclase (GGDEF)-like protein
MEQFLRFLRDKSIKFKVLLIYILSLFFIGVVGYSYYIYGNIKTIDREVSVYRNRLIKSKRQSVVNMVNVAINGINIFYKDFTDGKISETDAKVKAMNLIYSMRYNIGNNLANYVWINTVNGIMVVDPPKPELNGKNVLDYKDKNGVYLFRDMSRIVKANGTGFVSYCWPKLGMPKNICFPKTSYVRLFYPWQWIVGSGFYVDDVQKDIDRYVHRRRLDMIYTVSLSALLGGSASLIAGVIFFFIISSMVAHVRQLGELAGSLVDDDITNKLKLPYADNDELGSLIKTFNDFIDENYKLSLFKKVIEEDRDIDAVYGRIETLLKREFNISEFSLYEVNNSKNALKCVISSDNKLFCQQDILIDSTLCRAARTAMDVNSFEEENVCLSFMLYRDKKHVCIPLMVGGSVGSVAQIVFDKGADYVDVDKKIKRLKRFLREAAPVIEAKRLLSQLKESTLRDPLTGLYNRRFLDEFAATFDASVKRRNVQAGILMCDIDFFKQVNDVYGHNVGDEVLKGVVGAIHKAVREADLAVRFGGEEFLVLVQDADEAVALDVAERIRRDVESSEIISSGNVIKKTVSIGVSIFPEDSENLWKCIKYSDVAMYKAKTSGRNRVVRFEPSMWEGDEY